MLSGLGSAGNCFSGRPSFVQELVGPAPQTFPTRWPCAAGVDVWRWVDALHELPVTQLWERMEAASKQTPRPPRKGAHQQPALANTSSAAGQATARTGSGGDGADRSEGPARGQVPDDAGVAGGSASGAERPGGAGAGRGDSGYKQIMRVLPPHAFLSLALVSARGKHQEWAWLLYPSYQ